MRIAYIANARMPTEKAHGLQIMHMCRAFSQLGHDVTLVLPRRKNWIEQSVWEFYGMEPCFKIIQVPIVDFIVWDRWLGNWAHWLTTFWFGLSGRRVIEDLDPEVIYSRDPFSSAWTPRWVPNIFEARTFPNRFLWFYRRLWKQCDRVVTVTHGLKRMFLEQGVPEDRLRVAADAVDLEQFVVKESKEASRRALGLPLDRFLVVYAGHLYPYKGIPDLINACPMLTERIQVIVVGGRPDDLERTRKMIAEAGARNVTLVGRVPHKDVPRYLHAGDLCVMPYTRESHHVEYYSSPLKLFEYLAAGRAILTTDLPAVREVLDDETAEFVPPENPRALSDGINRLSGDPARLSALESHSARLAVQYTWKNRGRAVLEAMPKPRLEWKLTFFRKYRQEIQLALLALAVRVLYVTVFPQHPIEGGDGPLYLFISDIIRGLEEAPAGNLKFLFYPPAYPVILAGIRSVFGDDIVWIRLFQALFSAVTVFAACMMARRWVSPYAARIVGLIGALYVPMILESGILYTETTYAMFLTLAVWAFLHFLDRPETRTALLSGIVFALAGLTRELAYYTAVLLVIAAAARRRRAALLAVFILPTLLAVGAMAVRNREVASRQAVTVVPVIAKGFESTFREESFQERLVAPERLHMYPLGLFKFFRFPFRLLDISGGTSLKELVRHGDWRGIAAVWQEFAVKSFLLAFHWCLILLAWYGLWKGGVSREAKITFIVVIAFAAGSIVIGGVGRPYGFATFEPLARYRFPVEPLILILAAAGFERLSRRFAERATIRV